MQGFPDGWLFAGDTKKSRWSQIGQAMPVALAHAIANAVVEAMARAAKSEAA
ncbi:MAG: DNA cytosine methyltransferase [Steroidobacteraceae bacterium]